jgi:hypothetical protein
LPWNRNDHGGTVVVAPPASPARAQIPAKVNEIQFMILLASVIDHFHCGHTQLAIVRTFLSREVAGRKCFPFRLRIMDDRAYVIDNHSERDAVVRGSEVLVVNDAPFPAFLTKMLVAARADGPGRTDP